MFHLIELDKSLSTSERLKVCKDLHRHALNYNTRDVEEVYRSAIKVDYHDLKFKSDIEAKHTARLSEQPKVSSFVAKLT